MAKTINLRVGRKSRSWVATITDEAMGSLTDDFASGVNTGGAYDITINPGDNLASIVNGAAAGKKIFVNAGTYRITVSLAPANNVQITATPGTVFIDGSSLKTSWTADGSGRWYSSHTFQSRDSTMRDGTYSVCELTALQPGATGGSGASAFNSCWDRDQAWWDNARMTPVVTLAAGDAASGNRYYLDRTNSRLYVWNNPSGHTVEIDSTAYAVNNSTASGVKMTGLTFQKFASPLQLGAVTISGSGWEFGYCTFTNNHAHGLFTQNAANLWVHHCTMSYNGQLGMGAAGKSLAGYSGNVIEYCTFTGNNTEDFYIGDWESGGFKTSSSAGGILRNCTFTNNKGLDLWCDSASSQWVFERNVTDGAYGQAIRIEISSNVIVRYNTITRSGLDVGLHYRTAHPAGFNGIMDTCGISINCSQYVEVYGNTIDTNSLNGICGIVSKRGELAHVFVHNNTVTQRRTPIPIDGGTASSQGTMVAAGIYRLSTAVNNAAYYYESLETWSMPAIGPWAGSGVSASHVNEWSNNTYYVGDLNITQRFVWKNSAVTGPSYMTANTYATRNTLDAAGLNV